MRETAAASPRGTIVFVRTGDDERVLVRVRAELAASAWRVLEIGPDTRFDATSLAELASRYAARAALRAHESQATIELWVAGPGGAAETLRAPGTRPEDGVLALRATEALRARGLQIDRPEQTTTAAPGGSTVAPGTTPAPAAGSGDERAAAPGPSEAKATAPGAAPQDKREPDASERAKQAERVAEEAEEPWSPPSPPWSPGEYARGLWLEFAPAVLASPGHFPVAVSGAVALRLQPIRQLSLALFGYAPFTRAELRAAGQGTARISQVSLGAAVYARERFGRFELEFGGGLLGTRFAMTGDGDAKQGYTDGSATAYSGGPFGSANLHFNLGGGVRLCLGALLGVFAGQVVVRFWKTDVGHFGRPLVLGSLGLELPLLALGP